MKVLEYDDYETITDTLLYMSNLQLQFNVKLTYNDNRNNRKSFYSEIEYHSPKHNMDVRKINRRVNAFLTLGNIRDTDYYTKDNAMIGYQDMILLRQTLNGVMSNVMKNIQVNKKGTLELVNASNPDAIILHGKRVEFIPVILNFENEQVRGVRITLANYDNYSDITFDQFLAFKYIIDSFDIYGNAIALLNFIGRPEYGHNTFSMGGTNRNTSPF